MNGLDHYGNKEECSAPSERPFIQSHAAAKVKGDVEAVFPPHYRNRITLTHSPKGYLLKVVKEALYQEYLRLCEMESDPASVSRRFTCIVEVEEV